MVINPGADPWGTAMLVTGAGVALAVFVLFAAIATGTPKRAGTRILGWGSFLFLLTTFGGTWQRISAAEVVQQVAAAPKPAPVTIVATPPPPDPDGPAPGAPSPDATAQSAAESSAATPPEPEPEPEPAGAPASADALAPSVVATIDTTVVKLAEAPALPADDEARTAAVTAAIKTITALAQDDRQCADARAVAEAWVQLKSLPKDAHGAGNAVSKLEGCRKRVRSTKMYWVRRTRRDARNAYAEALPAKLKSDDSVVFVNVRGAAHERIRIGGKSMTPARVDALLEAGLGKHLAALGFAEATFASGNSTATHRYEVVTDAAMTDQVMARWGLGDRLSLK